MKALKTEEVKFRFSLEISVDRSGQVEELVRLVTVRSAPATGTGDGPRVRKSSASEAVLIAELCRAYRSGQEAVAIWGRCLMLCFTLEIALLCASRIMSRSGD